MIGTAHDREIAILTMSHGKANAMDAALCAALARRFEEIVASPARAIVLTGQGRIFCAGVDLVRALDEEPDYLRRFLPALRKAFEAVFFCPKPVVAAINGHAIAGGCVLACAADRRLMTRDGGRIGITELRVGVPFPVIALEIMRFAAVSHRLEELVFGAATYPPETGVELGLVDELADSATLMPRAIEAARALAEIAPETFALAKRQTRQVVADRLASDGPRHDAEVDRVWLTPAAAERIRGYVARTLKKG